MPIIKKEVLKNIEKVRKYVAEIDNKKEELQEIEDKIKYLEELKNIMDRYTYLERLSKEMENRLFWKS
jgi:hypothetical protein